MANFKSGLGSNIKLLRKMKNITQEELSEIIGIHSRQLSKIETGEHFPSCKTLEKICIALDVTPKELFDFEFLMDVYEGVLTGTGTTVAYRVERTSDDENVKDNVYQLYPNSENKNIDVSSSDESMAKTAKAINRPVFVEYFDENKVSKIVVFYPDGKEKVIKNSVDVEAKQNMIMMMSEFKKIAKDSAATEFIQNALSALSDDEALKNLSILVQGMKLARRID